MNSSTSVICALSLSKSAPGGMAASLVGMLAAALGYLPALEGAILQEIIDFLAVANAVRVSLPP